MKTCNNKCCNCRPFLFWGLLAIFYVYQYIARSSIPTTLTDHIMAHYGLDSAGVGALLGCYYYAYTFMQAPAGMLIDKFGIRNSGAFATFICAAGLAIFIATSNYFIGALGQIMVGFGSAFAFLALLKCITSWFAPAKATVMTSVSAAFGPIGPVFAGPAIAVCAQSMCWKSMILDCAVIGMILAVAIYAIVRDKETTTTSVDEEKIGFFSSILFLLKKSQIWIVSLYIMGLYAPISALADLWGVKFIQATYDIGTAQASVASNMIYVGVIVGSFVSGFLCNFLKSHKKVMLLLCAISSAAFLFIVLSHVSYNAMLVLLFITGFGTGGCAIAFVAATCLVPSHMCGITSGLVNMFCMLSGVILQPLIGFIINLHWDGVMANGIPVYKAADYSWGIFAVMFFLVASMISAFAIKETYKK